MAKIAWLGKGRDELVGKRCREVLEGGGLVVFPTDTVYGLAASPLYPEAVERVYEVKGREREKALVIMVSRKEEAESLVRSDQRGKLKKLAHFWPGPLTLVARSARIPWGRTVCGEGDTIGLRIPGHDWLLRLLEETGPLAVTSANFSGRPAPAAFEEVEEELLHVVEMAVRQKRKGSGRPSTVVDISGDGIRVLRRGEIGEEALLSRLKRRK
jgi:L-threonylcarbamoyladenylate synthase